MPQSTLITLSQFLSKNNLQPLYELQFFFFLPSIQLQSLISILCTETFVQCFLVTLLLQNTFSQMENGLWTLLVFFFLMVKSTYYPLAILIHVFSSIIFFLVTLVRIKHKNLFAIVIPGQAFMLIYNSSTIIALQVLCHLYTI